MMNDGLVLRCSEAMARRLLARPGLDDAGRIHRRVPTAYGRPADDGRDRPRLDYLATVRGRARGPKESPRGSRLAGLAGALPGDHRGQRVPLPRLTRSGSSLNSEAARVAHEQLTGMATGASRSDVAARAAPPEAAAVSRRWPLAGLPGARRRGPARAASTPRNPLAPRPPHFPRQGQAGDLPVHARRAVAGRHVRSQAAPGARPRQAPAVRQAARRLEQDRQPAALAVQVPATRPERDRRSASCFPHLAGCVDDLCVINSMHGSNSRHGGALARAPHRQRHVRPAEHGLVDHLRAGDREPGPARLHHDLPEPEPRRREQLELGVPAGRLPGDADRRRGRPLRPGEDPVHHQHGPRPRESAAARARPDPGDEPRPPRSVRARPGPRRPDRLVRAGLPHAGGRARDPGHLGRVGRDAAALRARRRGHAELRPPVPDGPAVRRARGAVRPGLAQLQVGPARRPEEGHRPERPRGRPADRRPAQAT